MAKKALILGASKTIGRGIAEQLAERGWEVTGTVRQNSGTQLHELAAKHPEYGIRIEQLDVLKDADIQTLHDKLAGEKFDLILYNPGMGQALEIKDMAPELFIKIMMTNVYAPLRCIENLDDLLADGGTIAALSSAAGSLALNNTTIGGAYNASKAGLNNLMKTYSNIHPERTILLLHPGWVQTDLDPDGGNAYAPTTVEESTHGLVNVLETHVNEPGIQFISYQNQELPW